MIGCKCTKRHVPLPMTYRLVKVGDDVVQLCPTTFANVKELLTEFQIRSSVPPGRITKHYSKYVRGICLALWKESLKPI